MMARRNCGERWTIYFFVLEKKRKNYLGGRATVRRRPDAL